MTDTPVRRRLVKVSTAAELYPIGVNSIRGLIRDGKLAGYKPTGKKLLLVDADELARLVEDSRVAASV